MFVVTISWKSLNPHNIIYNDVTIDKYIEAKLTTSN